MRDIAFLDTDTLFWQLAQQHSTQYQAHSRAGIPNLGRQPSGTAQVQTEPPIGSYIKPVLKP